ncbi:MAG: hypothetical protein K1X83_08860 [Oligoflexia bacterium]|nr:hypothetical protein [Oligoflexia bacterium]
MIFRFLGPLLLLAPACSLAQGSLCVGFDGTLPSAISCEGGLLSLDVNQDKKGGAIEQRLTGIPNLDPITGKPVHNHELEVLIGDGATAWRSVLLSRTPIVCPAKIRVEGRVVLVDSHSAPGTKSYKRPWIQVSKFSCL